MPHASIVQISVSPGGVPKKPVEEAVVTALGLVGDGHHDTKHHGGPERAVCLFAIEVIERLAAEGHPITPGATGENLTLRGVPWPDLVPGARLAFAGGVELEVTAYTTPCATIRNAFLRLEHRRVSQDLHPGESRVYARVLREGRVVRGESVTVRSPASG